MPFRSPVRWLNVARCVALQRTDFILRVIHTGPITSVCMVLTYAHNTFSASGLVKRTLLNLVDNHKKSTPEMFKHLASLLLGLSLLHTILAASRTGPPSGSIVVRTGTTTAGEYKTVSSAVAALPNDSSSRSIFIYPGTYNEQVYITRSGPLTVRDPSFSLNYYITDPR
jgi:hypothetical protein